MKCLRTIRVNTLGEHRNGAQNQSFCKTQFQNADKNEQKIHRQRSGDARQIYPEPRSQNGDAKVADKFRNVFAALVDSPVDQNPKADSHHECDERLRGEGQTSPRARVLGQTYGDTGCTSHLSKHTTADVLPAYLLNTS